MKQAEGAEGEDEDGGGMTPHAPVLQVEVAARPQEDEDGGGMAPHAPILEQREQIIASSAGTSPVYGTTSKASAGVPVVVPKVDPAVVPTMRGSVLVECVVDRLWRASG